MTVHAGNGELSHVDAKGETYEAAKAAAEAMIHEGSRAISIRILRTDDEA